MQEENDVPNCHSSLKFYQGEIDYFSKWPLESPLGYSGVLIARAVFHVAVGVNVCL